MVGLLWGWCPGGGNGNPLQDSCLENFRGQRSLEGCSPWGHKELDTTTEATEHTGLLRHSEGRREHSWSSVDILGWPLKFPVQLWMSFVLYSNSGKKRVSLWVHDTYMQLFATPWAVSSPPGSSVHGIPQARILEWVSIAFSYLLGIKAGTIPPRNPLRPIEVVTEGKAKL